MIRSNHAHDDADAPLDPKVIAELDQLDAALRGEAITDDALAQLVRDVQAQAPEMPTELRSQLGDDVAAGFPRFGKAGARRADRRSTATTAPKRSRRLLLGGGFAAAAAAACCVLVVGLVMTNGGDDFETASQGLSDVAAAPDTPTSAGQSGDAATSEAAPSAAAPGAASERFQSSGGSSERAAPAPGSAVRESGGSQDAQELLSGATADSAGSSSSSSSSAAKSVDQLKPATSTPASGRRRVEQSVEMSVRVKSGELDEAAGKVGEITRRAGGFVADSQVSMRTRGAGSATFTLQVASSKLDGAIGALSDLGTVTRQDQRSDDITSSFDTAGQRLGDAKAVRKALLRSLDKADSAGQIASLRARIADNRKTIAGLESEILKLERRTNLTTIALTLRAPSGDAPSGDDDGRWSIGDAIGDAGSVLGTIGGGLIVAGAVILPFALIGGLGWSVYLIRRKRSRDAALDD